MSRVFFAIAIWLSPRRATIRHILEAQVRLGSENESRAPWIELFRGARSFYIFGSLQGYRRSGMKSLRPDRSPVVDRRQSFVLPHKCNANSFADSPGDSYLCA